MFVDNLQSKQTLRNVTVFGIQITNATVFIANLVLTLCSSKGPE